MMEKAPTRNNSNETNPNCRDRSEAGGDSSLLLKASSEAIRQSTPSDFVLQWGNRKRLRCMKIQVKDKDKDDRVHRTTVRVDRRVVRAEKDTLNQTSANNVIHSNGYVNLRQRPSSPQPPPSHRVRRNSESSGAMRGGGGGGQSNGGVRGIASPDREKKGTSNNNNHHNDKSAATSDMPHESRKGWSSSGSGEAAAVPTFWPPKFLISLTNKEKEEDFMALKGSKLPQRPKKRAKIIQRTVNLVSPGTWLCDLTLERYEVREKKTSKKRPRGLKAIGNMDSDSY